MWYNFNKSQEIRRTDECYDETDGLYFETETGMETEGDEETVLN